MTTTKAGPRWSRLEHDARREQILSTARALFTQRPYGAVSTIEIAEAAGVTRGLLHHYFGNKRALYLEVVKELVDSPVIGVLDALTATPAAGAATPSWEDSVALWMDVVEANQEAWLVAISAGETGSDRAMHDILDESRERTADQVIRVLGLDEKRMPEARALVRGFGGFAEEITREWLQRRRLSKEQARVLLVGALPGMVAELLPGVIEKRGAAK
ncbi:MAG TPA: helix-turn-helix domain-containing protein [Mycobacteriales bacterium]|nr:helix-turn-helix domain-containing protein [Mycobacteriales bacterium]HWA65378.1 helix-turn-helix domain-containing protein [Mycobacteriales bacterium]